MTSVMKNVGAVLTVLGCNSSPTTMSPPPVVTDPPPPTPPPVRSVRTVGLLAAAPDNLITYGGTLFVPTYGQLQRRSDTPTPFSSPVMKVAATLAKIRGIASFMGT